MAKVLLADEAWRQLVDWRGIKILLRAHARDLAPIILASQRGIFLGPLFHNDAPLTSSPDVEILDGWCADHLEAFGRMHWGPYLGLLADHVSDRLMVVRSPGAGHPCYRTLPDDAGLTILFTDLADLARLRPLGEIDTQYLSMFLALPRLVSPRTGLCDVREILGGQCLSLERDDERAWVVWAPPPSDRGLAYEETPALCTRLRQTIVKTVGAFSKLARPIVHRLSGGLDSSVALVGLMEAGADVVCVSERPLGFEEGDETEAAAEVARALGAPHVVVDYQASDIDYSRLLAAPAAVKPSSALLTFADPHFAAVLQTETVIATSGQGGDQVFARANALAAMGDAVAQRMSLSKLIAIALDIAHVSGRSVWPVFKTGVEYGLGRPGRNFIRAVLARAAAPGGTDRASAIDEALSHPWIDHTRRRGPAEIAHALFLADLAYYHAPSLLNATCPNFPVLASEPLMALCSEIPAHTMMRGGRDRALVREAFRDVLPPVALDRRRKGDTTRYFAAVAENNKNFVRAMMDGGELEAFGLRASGSPIAYDVSADFIAEIWLRQVRALRQASAPLHAQSPDA